MKLSGTPLRIAIAAIGFVFVIAGSIFTDTSSFVYKNSQYYNQHIYAFEWVGVFIKFIGFFTVAACGIIAKKIKKKS